MSRLALTFVAILLLTTLVCAIGVIQPRPKNIELKPGEASYFTFQVQSDDFPLECVPTVDDAGGLELAFNQEYQVGANEKYNIQPQVIVPEKTGYGDYEATFCMECFPMGDIEGSVIVPRFCGLSVTANVVSDRTRPNMFDEKGGQAGWMFVMVILAFAILILAAVIYYLVRRRKRVSGV